jgi:hypothetical protein
LNAADMPNQFGYTLSPEAVNKKPL